jgi:cytidylate kinase
MKTELPIITIDGPSGTGKGTICHQLAAHLGWHFLDSGVLYRVLAYAALQQGIAFTQVQALVDLAARLDLRFDVDAAQNNVVFLNHHNVSAAIRSEDCGQNASKIGAIPEVRQALLELQRNFAKPPGLVTDGRDMGTVVFPQAKLKIYLDASIEERANRRYLQLKKNGNDASLAQVIDELRQRDARDKARACSPLKPADDAVFIDTSGLSIVQVFDSVLKLLA